MVRVNGEQIQYRENMTLAEALDAVCLDVGAPMLITVNGILTDKVDAKHTVIDAGTEIRVMPILSGG